MPKEVATLGDITCDSDGKIDRFVDLKDVKDMLEFHTLDNAPYYLAVLFWEPIRISSATSIICSERFTRP